MGVNSRHQKRTSQSGCAVTAILVIPVVQRIAIHTG